MFDVQESRVIREIHRFARQLYLRYISDRLPLVSAAITYYLLLSLVPLLLLAVSVAAFFISPHQAEARIAELTAALDPNFAHVLRTQVLSVVRHRGALTGVALLLGFWVGSQVFVTLEYAVNQVWHSTLGRPYWKRRGLALLMVMLIGALIVFAVILTNLIRIISRLALPLLGHPVAVIPFFVATLISGVIPILLVSAIFAALYRILPTREVTVRSVLPGALFASVLWTLFLHVFGWYTTHFTNFSLLYGSLGGLILLLLWLNYSATVFLLGAEITVLYHLRLIRAGDEEERRVAAEAAGEKGRHLAHATITRPHTNGEIIIGGETE